MTDGLSMSCAPKLGQRMRRYMFLGALFLLAQLFSVAHASQFGDHPHTHDEISCTIQAAGAAAKSVNVVASVAVPMPPASIATTVRPQEVSAVSQKIYRHRHIRAPPPLVF